LNDFDQIFIIKVMEKYSRERAVLYARNYWNKRNPKFYNFDKIGGDCTNFVSQCLFYGGFDMKFTTNGWFYSSINLRSPAWSGVNEFCDFLITNISEDSPKGRIVSLSDIEVGDVIQLDLGRGFFHHNTIVTNINGEKNFNNILIACHTADAFDKPLSDYNIKKTRCIKIMN